MFKHNFSAQRILAILSTPWNWLCDKIGIVEAWIVSILVTGVVFVTVGFFFLEDNGICSEYKKMLQNDEYNISSGLNEAIIKYCQPPKKSNTVILMPLGKNSVTPVIL